MTIAVLVAGEEEPLRAAISALVDGEAGLTVVASASGADDAIALARATSPRVALVDVRIPGGGPVAALRIREHSPGTRIVALSAGEDAATLLEMLRAGAVGSVEGTSPAEVVEAIRRADRGLASLSAVAVERVVSELADDVDGRHGADGGPRRGARDDGPAGRDALLAHLVTAAEEERRRIAGDIHDDSLQVIAAAGMRLQILRRSLHDPGQLRLLAELDETVKLAISRLRHLLFELRPPALDGEGLSAALELYLEEAGRQTTTRYRLDDRLRSQPDEPTRVLLFRIVQEALADARSASAENATVTLEERDGGFLVRVVDDGLAADAAPSAPGPATMREHARLLGGRARVQADATGGTAVEVWIPARADALPDERDPARRR